MLMIIHNILGYHSIIYYVSDM